MVTNNIHLQQHVLYTVKQGCGYNVALKGSGSNVSFGKIRISFLNKKFQNYSRLCCIYIRNNHFDSTGTGSVVLRAPEQYWWYCQYMHDPYNSYVSYFRPH